MNYTAFLVPRFYLGMTTKRLRLQYKKKEAEPLTMHSQVEPGNEKNDKKQRISVRFNALKLLARNLFLGGKTTQNRGFECVVHTYLGLKSQADSESPLKWTVMGFCSFLKKILAIAQLIRVHIYQFQPILISVRFNALKLLARNLFLGGKTTQNRRFECVVHTHLGMEGIQ